MRAFKTIANDCVKSKPFDLPFIHPIILYIPTMRVTIAKSVIEFSKCAARKSKPLHMQQVFTSSSFPLAPTSLEDCGFTKRSHSNHEEDYYLYSSWESTLERVLEMTQLGKEESIHWEKVVRSAYKTEYHEEDGNTCHLCGKNKSAHELCRRCLNVESSKSIAGASVQTSDSFTQRPSCAP